MTTRAQKGIFKLKHPGLLHEIADSPLLTALLSTIEPRGFKSAAKLPPYMRRFVRFELTILVPRPSHGNIVGAKWVY